MRKQTMLPVILCMILSLVFPCVRSDAASSYLPDVTASMSSPAYWTKKAAAPDEILVTEEEIAEINQSILTSSDCGMHDLASWSQDTFNGISRGQTLKNAALDDAEYSYSGLRAKYKDGVRLETFDEALEKLYGPLIDNCVDPEATESMPTGYAICTRRTTLRSFPTDQPLPDDPTDPDFDVLYLSAVSVGEPLVVRGRSADGLYYHAMTTYLSGWVPAEDIAFCKDKAEWLSAWQFDSKDTLVVYTDKIYTEESNYAPQTSKRKLSMGTRLRIADSSEWEGLISNRSAYNNYVVRMPVRLEDGSYDGQLALISEHCKVHEGYLPLTSSNLAKVMFEQLGDAYGWGGMMGTNDCSGYIRDVYRCFGLEMARNTTQQAKQPVRRYDLSGKSDAEKAAIIKSLPLGSELLFNGHAMLYLGSENDKLYVISSVSSAYVDKKFARIRGAVINTLDITRGSGNTWLRDLHTAAVPYYKAQAESITGASVAALPDVVYTGQAFTPKPVVTIAGKKLKEHVHYNLSYADNTDVGTASVIITGKGNYTGELRKTFRITSAGRTVSLSLSTTVYTYNGSVRTPAVTVKYGSTTLPSSDYTVSYAAGRKKVGRYLVTASLKGRYHGSASATFMIIPKGTTISSIKKGKQAFTVRWKKRALKMSTARITGYQVQYATNKAFTNGRETVTLKKYTRVKKTITQLRKKKRYYVRVRTYMKVAKKNYYSSWSKVRTVITK